MAKVYLWSGLVLLAWVVLPLSGCSTVSEVPVYPTSPAAQEFALQQAYENRLAEASSNLSRVAAAAIGLGILAFLFGHLLAIPRWASAATVGLGLLVATMAPQLIEFFGSDHAHYIMLATFGVLALGSLAGAGMWFWNKVGHLTPVWKSTSKPDAPHENPKGDE